MSSTNGTVQPPAAADPATLPDFTSNTLELVPVTPAEAHICAAINSKSWCGPLTAEAYIRRERHLAATKICRDGGLTGWALVDSNDRSSPRTILSACETLRKRGLVAKKGYEAEEVTVHGIGSVFCRDEYRGRGYAGRMMRELGRVLEGWQQSDGKRSYFNVLFSDIGKKFYTKHGWKPFSSSHVAVAPVKGCPKAEGLPEAIPIHDEDLDNFCRDDERMIKSKISNFTHEGPDIQVALIPDAETLRWHHAREEFVAQENFQRQPNIKGAYVKATNGDRVWCVWTRVFSKRPDENILYILRFVIENENLFETASNESTTDGVDGESALKDSHICAVAACLRAAQSEAADWNMHQVQTWNPSPTVLAGAKRLDPAAELVHRTTESITSLLWYGDGEAQQSVKWISNEKFGWC